MEPQSEAQHSPLSPQDLSHESSCPDFIAPAHQHGDSAGDTSASQVVEPLQAGVKPLVSQHPSHGNQIDASTHEQPEASDAHTTLPVPAVSAAEQHGGSSANNGPGDSQGFRLSIGAVIQPAAESPAAQAASPVVLADTPQFAGNKDVTQASPREAASASTSPPAMQAAVQEGLVLPDSAGPSQQGQLDAELQGTGRTAPASPVPNHVTSDSASLEAALALAALASGEKRPHSAEPATSFSSAAQPVEGRRRRKAQHSQCQGSRMPLNAIQRTAAVQRQPLKPAWQHSGRVTAGWGAKGQRTRSQHGKLPQGARTGKQQQASTHAKMASEVQAAKANGDSQLGHHGKVIVSNTFADSSLSGSKTLADKQPHASSKLARSSQTATDSKGNVGHAATSSRIAPTSIHAASNDPTISSKHAGANKMPVEMAGTSQSMSQSQPHGNNCAKPGGACAQQADRDSDDDDDFKPDVRRRPRSLQQSPQGSRKKAKLSAAKALDDAVAEAEHSDQTKPIGQALLHWNPASQEWDHQIITAFDASKVRQ